MARKGLLKLFLLCIFLLKLTSGLSRRVRQIDDPGLILVRVSKLETLLYEDRYKLSVVEKRLSDIKIKLDQLSGGMNEARVNGKDILSKEVHEILKDSLNGMQAGLIKEKEERLRIEIMALNMKENLKKNEKRQEILENKVDILEQTKASDLKTTANIQNRLTYYTVNKCKRCPTVTDEQLRLATTQSPPTINTTPKDNSPTDTGKQPTTISSLQFSGKAMNYNDSRIVNDCADLWEMGYRKDGVFRVNIIKDNPILINCNLQETTRNWNMGGRYTHLRGWMVIQRRQSGTQDFEKTWNEYKEGFGKLDSEFWLGNEILWHAINSSTDKPLLFMRLYNSDQSYYDRFLIYTGLSMANEKYQYRMAYRGFSYGEETKEQGPGRGAFMTKDKQSRGSKCPPVNAGWWYEGWPKCTKRHYIPNSRYQNLTEKQKTYQGYTNTFYTSRSKSNKTKSVIGSELLVYFRQG